MTRHLITQLGRLALAALVLPLATSADAAPTVFTDAGDDAADIQATVDAFRDALGALNAPAPVQNTGGRRQIDWDAAPDAVSAPNAFPGDFFNFSAAPRARGIEFTTPGSGFFLSATDASGVGIEFDNIDPSYSDTFDTFSPERLFTPYESVITIAKFFSPADQTTPATTRGFGAVFSDVDYTDVSRIDYFDENDNLLTTVYAPAAGGDETLSFAGAVYDEAIISSVWIYSGNTPLAPGVTDDPSNGVDLVVLDDFIFGEPVPEPTAFGLVALALGAFGVRRR
ncbi:MAG: PEP-CTERM sorting domain-containing protein [Planctomycetota bacterium]